MRILTIAALLTAGAAQAAEGPHLEKAIDLPLVAQALSDDGVPDADINEAIDAGTEAKLSAGETAEILDEADKAAKEHGPIDNFGAWVHGQLKDGKRGQELAAAIKAEHEARGKGKPDGAGKPDGKPAGGGAGKVGKGGKAGKAGKAGGGK